MFEDIKIEILNSNLKVVGYAIGDLQEFSTEIEIENYKFVTTKRLFIDYIESKIDSTAYMRISNTMYKPLKVKTFSDYMEIWLYELKRQV